MDQGKRKLATALLAAAAFTTTAASLRALPYAEAGDAGQTLATAQNAGAFSGTPASITGSISGGADADLYSFTLSAATNLQISAVGGTSSVYGPAPIDTSLFLFDSTGRGLLANNDQGGTSYQGQLTISLAAGTYYLGISLSGNEAVNSANQYLFAQNGASTDVRQPVAGVNPATLNGFDGGTTFPEAGTYAVNFASVPEPSTYATLALGAVASLAFIRRRRQAA